MKFSTDYPWLFATDGKLGCTTCRDTQSLGPNRTVPGMRVQLAKEWISGGIQPYGETHDQRMRAIRKKIYDHRDSPSHKTAESLLAQAKTQPIETVLTDNSKELVDITCKVFRTVYYVAKENRPFVDHSSLIDLQTMNGIRLGRMLHSNVTAADIADHIADEMRKKLVCAVLDAKLPFSTLIDESTSLSQKSCLIVYLRCSVDNTCEPVCVFLDLLELDGTNADAIVASLMKCLHDNGFTDDILHDR